MTRTTIARTALLAITTVVARLRRRRPPRPARPRPPRRRPRRPPPRPRQRAPRPPPSRRRPPARRTNGTDRAARQGLCGDAARRMAELPVDPAALQEIANALGTTSRDRPVAASGRSTRARPPRSRSGPSTWATPRQGRATPSRSSRSRPRTSPCRSSNLAVKGQISASSADRRRDRDEAVTLPVGEALRLTYTLTVPNAAGGRSSRPSQVMYWIQTAPSARSSVTGTGPDAAKDAELQAIVESIEEV